MTDNFHSGKGMAWDEPEASLWVNDPKHFQGIVHFFNPESATEHPVVRADYLPSVKLEIQ
jgi:hypothetical protein